MTSTVSVELFISADGWAGSDGLPGYFGYLGPELEQWLGVHAGEPHVALMGRKTYEMLSGLPDDARDDSWGQMVQRPTVVFSRTITEVEWPNAEVRNGDVVDEVRRLKHVSDVPMRTIGSLSLVRQLLAGGLVDQVRLVTFPLFAGDAGREWAYTDIVPADLQLIDHRVLDGRILVVEYRPTGNDIPRA